MIISAVLFALSLLVYVFLWNNTEKAILYRIIYSFTFFISSLLFIIYFAINDITGNGITDAFLYMVRSNLDGVGYSQFSSLIIKCVVLIIVSISLSIILYLIKGEKKYRLNKILSWANNNYIFVALLFVILSIFISPTISAFGEAFYIKDQQMNTDSEFYDYYQIPQISKIGESKNLVFIYAESLERTYFDDDIFPGLITNLKDFQNISISFTNIVQDYFSNNTISGTVASQCGIPLVSPSYSNSMSGMDSFLGSAICLGDLLHKEKYFLSYYRGADIRFAGADKFFSTHSFDEVKGKYELIPNIESLEYKNDWGIYDDELLDIDFDHFIELSKKKQKFAFFTLTLDTHHPTGYSSKECISKGIKYSDGDNSVLNSVACADYLISNFVNKIRASEYSDNTVIVLVSDHLAMKNTASEVLANADRRNLFIINTSDMKGGKKIDIPGFTLDTGTTILPFIGLKGNIGLGRDILDKNYSQDIAIKYLDEMKSWAPEVMAFWNFPKIVKDIKISLTDSNVDIDGRNIKFPTLIKLNDSLETKPMFDLNSIPLSFYYNNMDTSTPYLMINRCSIVAELIKSNIDSVGICLLSGRKDIYYNYQILNSDTVFTKYDIKKMLDLM